LSCGGSSEAERCGGEEIGREYRYLSEDPRSSSESVMSHQGSSAKLLDPVYLMLVSTDSSSLSQSG
jgi:hypothetical protein